MPQENGSGGPRGGGRGREGGAPGQGPRRDGPGGFGGRDGGRGRGEGPGRGRGRDGRREEGGGGPGQRVVSELSALEKALSKMDFAAQKAPLESIVRALRPMRLKSLDELDLNVRGRLITTLLRVQRQPRPPTPEGMVVAPGPEAPAVPAAAGELGSALGATGVVAASTQTPPGTPGHVPGESVGISEGSPTETQERAEGAALADREKVGAPPAGGGDASVASPPGTPGHVPGESVGISEGSPTVTQEQAQAPEPVRERYQAYTDVMYLVGRAWRAAGDPERATAAFALSERRPTPEPEESAVARPVTERRDGERRERRERPEGERRERRERPEGERRERREGERRERPEGERRERPEGERRERPEGERRERRPPLPELTGDWQEQVKQLEAQGRTRDAGRMHERHNSFAEAARLFEAGGDIKSALRCALAGKDQDSARRLVAALPAEQTTPVLEKAGAYELLMEHYISKGDFENVARLYERARQYDQAALAYERSGKLSLARKAYERARDFASANRVRDLEAKALVERGDRLGAATLLVSAGRQAEAVEVLSALPPPKAFHFLQRLNLAEEAKALAQRELARAEAENKPAGRARWLELLGETAAAAALYEEIGRKERALTLYEQLGDLPRAAALAEQLQLRDKALALYNQLGDAAGVARAEVLPATPPPSSRSAESAEAEPGTEQAPENASGGGSAALGSLPTEQEGQ